jgi:regulator of protease activity HflC (stomatin/prohibitin superfamily)
MYPLIALSALLLVPTLAWLAMVRVDDGQIAIVGGIGGRRVLGTGLHFKLPLLERVERRLSTIGRSVELNNHTVGDGWQIGGRVYYQILDAGKAAPELEHLEETVTRELDHVLPAFLTEHRNAPGDVFNGALKQSLNARLRQRGILVARTQIQAAA